MDLTDTGRHQLLGQAATWISEELKNIKPGDVIVLVHTDASGDDVNTLTMTAR